MENLIIQNKKDPILIAISGVKNSGKTSLIEKLIPRLLDEGYKVATIKHDGHDFEADVENRDSYRHKEAGAFGTAIFSNEKFMIIKEQKYISEKELISLFPEADLILLEGFKSSNYPKIEIVRRGVSEEIICKKETLIAVVTDLDIKEEGIKVININDINEITEALNNYIRRCKGERCI